MIAFVCMEEKESRGFFTARNPPQVKKVVLSPHAAQDWVERAEPGFKRTSEVFIVPDTVVPIHRYELAQEAEKANRKRSSDYHRRAQKAEGELLRQQRKFEKLLAEKDEELKAAALQFKNWCEMTEQQEASESNDALYNEKWRPHSEVNSDRYMEYDQ